MFWFELNSIRSSTIESSLIFFIIHLAFLTFINLYLMRCIVFFVLSLGIKFVFIWLICIFLLVMCRLNMKRFVVYSVCRLNKLRIIMTLVHNIGTFWISFHSNIIGFVKMMVGCVCLELCMCGRTVMFP